MTLEQLDGQALRAGDDLGGALRIADELAAGAVWSRGVCAFHGTSAPVDVDLPPLHRSFGGDAYDGSSGVARFLALVATLADDEDLAVVARGALAHAVARYEGWSLFTGGAGVALVAWEVAAWLHEPGLAREANRILSDAASAALQTRDEAPADLLSGMAGVVVALTTALDAVDAGRIVVRRVDAARWKAAALELGEHLLAAAHRKAGGMSWPVYPGGPQLCGLAHGASGVALAYETLARRAPGDPRWSAAARQARRFERARYSVESGSWADLRTEPPAYPHMWCHGSVGITAERLGADAADELARTDLVAGLAGAAMAAEALAAAPAGPAAGDELNGSQCHGLGGMSDVFVSAWERDGDDSWLAIARACTAQLRRDARRPEGWRCGVLGGDTTPGLMLGLAGIGWAQLRAELPEEVPSAWRLGDGLRGRTPRSI